MKARVLLDVDGVICNLEDHWLEIARELIGHLPHCIDPHASEFEQKWRIPPEYATLLSREFYTRPIDMLEPLPGAIEGVVALMKSHDVHFVTTSMVPHPTWDSDRRRWFRRMFSPEAARRLCFVRYKYIVSGDFFVDDYSRNVRGWSEHNKGRAIWFGSTTCPDWTTLSSILPRASR
jgi:5'(3')-deoxyribonucleotidase